MKRTKLLFTTLLASAVSLCATAQLNVGSISAPVPSAKLQVAGSITSLSATGNYVSITRNDKWR
jgi:hypothetical protein